MAVCNDFIHCECASIVEEMEWEQGELMKARDELLEALEALVLDESEIPPRLPRLVLHRHRRRLLNAARAAIAKAKGSQTCP
jgi:hypothetical protein